MDSVVNLVVNLIVDLVDIIKSGKAGITAEEFEKKVQLELDRRDKQIQSDRDEELKKLNG